MRVSCSSKIFLNYGYPSKSINQKSKLIKLLHEYDIKSNLTIFDVGAYKGQTSQYFYKSFPKSNIYCFEPSPILFEELKKNTRKYERIHQYNIGLGAKTSNLYLTCPESDLCGQIKDRKTTNCIPVKIMTIDEISLKKNINHIDLLKVDVEGYEIEVLKGCDRMFLSEKARGIV